jgi:hypothetical protein
MADIVVELTKSAATQNQWTGSLTNIPAGTARVFKGAAYKNPGTAAADLIYAGETLVNVQAGATATVTLLLQEQNPPVGPTRYAPQLTSLTVSNAYVLPNTPVSIHATAVDPDHQGDPLTYSFSSICDAGSGSFTPSVGSGGSIDTVFNTPGVNATCQVSLLVKETAQAGNQNTPLSVTTYFTIVVNANFGQANVTAFPNSYPIITLLGDFRYNYFSDVTIMPVGQQGDFQFSATDPDGDNVQYDLTAKCGTANGTDFSAVAATPALSSDYFWYFVPNSSPQQYVGHATGGNGTTFRATGSNGVTPPSPYTSQWNPHFGGTTDGFTFSDPSKDCQFTLTVHDLCTNGNCGAAGQGGLPDGSFKTTTVGGVSVTSATVGVINTTHPSKPDRAPVVESVETVNQNGPTATGVQTWDPQKVAIVSASQPYNIAAAADDRWESSTTPPTVVWSCNTGSVSAPSNTTGTYAFGSGVANLTSHVVFTTGPAVPPTAQCTATFTSSSSSLSTVVTFRFSTSDPCNSLPTNSACSTGNVCLTGQTCQGPVGAQTCQGGSAVVCAVSDSQCQTPTCDPALGCGVQNIANNTACNADSNGCTGNDSCQAGHCTAGAAVVCNTPADAQCQSASGTCQSTGNNTHVCNYVSLSDGTSCNADNNGCTQGDSCSAGHCAAGAAVVCSNTTNPCESSTGTCVSTGASNFTCNFTPVTNGTSCNVAGTCVAGQTCQAGQCQGGNPACQPGQSCTPTTPTATCTASTVTPTSAQDLQVSPPSVLAMATDGSTYAAANFVSNTPVSFGPFSLTSSGGADIFVAKYDATGAIQFATLIGDDGGPGTNTDQTATGIALNNGGRIGLIGKITGSVTFGANTIATASPTPYIAAVSNTDGGATAGTRFWAHSFDLGTNGTFSSVSANPGDASGRYAVCGSASKAGTQLVPGTTFGGGVDLVVAVFDSAGNKLWAIQLGGTGNENCQSVAVDQNGDVFATGQFDGASLAFCSNGPSSNGVSCTGTTTTLTGPNTTARKFIWVAKFAGATGNTIAATAYSGGAGVASPNSLAVNSAGDVAMGGSFSGLLTIGAALTNQGSSDAFAVKLNGTSLIPVWNAVAWGGTGTDLVRQVAFDSFGDIIAVGTANPSTTAFRTANGGHDTIGEFSLNVNGTSSSDAFVVKINGTTGGADNGTTYGAAGSESGDALAVNRFSANNQIAFSMLWTGTATIGGAGSVTAAGGLDSALVFAHLQ